VFSTYESRSAPSDAKSFQRGINSIELYNDGQRWWIASLLWRPGTPGWRCRSATWRAIDSGRCS